MGGRGGGGGRERERERERVRGGVAISLTYSDDLSALSSTSFIKP